MRNLLAFISRYNAFFLFLIFEITSLVLYIKYNSFQKASFINSSNEVTGAFYSRMDDFYSYLSLRNVNDALAKENARLRNRLNTSFYVDSVSKHTVNDTVYKQQYSYISAKVINNSTNHINNYLTLNRGSSQGIAKGMGVICDSGVVGKVVLVSNHYALVQSMLHKDSRFSAMLAGNREIGYVEWGDGLNPHAGVLKDISNNAVPKLGEKVTTSGYSLFPEGINIGYITSLHTKAGGASLNMEIKLAVDFTRLQYVYVVMNKFAAEQAVLEAQQKKE